MKFNLSCICCQKQTTHVVERIFHEVIAKTGYVEIRCVACGHFSRKQVNTEEAKKLLKA